MNRAIFAFAWNEWHRSFARSVPKGVGARDFLWLTVVVLVVNLLVILAHSALVSVPLRIDQTLLGAIEKGQRPIRLTRNFIRTEGLSASTVLHIQSDPALAGFAMAPQRHIDFGKGRAFDWPVPLEVSRNNEALSVIALSEISPVWVWGLQGIGDAETASENAATPPGGWFSRNVIGNASLFDARFPPSGEDYAAYRDKVLALPQYRVYSRYLPEAISSWSDLSHLILQVKRASEGTKRPDYLAFRMHWRAGLPIPETAALLLPLSTVDAVEAAVARPTTFDYDIAGAGSDMDRFTHISGELYGDDSDKPIVALLDTLAACLGGGRTDDIVERTEWSYAIDLNLNRPAGAVRLSWAAEDIGYCLREREDSGDILRSREALDGRVYLARHNSGTGGAVAMEVRDGKVIFGVLRAPCRAMNTQDHNLATVNAHAAAGLCRDDSDNRDVASADGAIFLEPYNFATFVRTNEDVEGDLSTILSALVQPFRGQQDPADAELLEWSVESAQTRLGGPALFDYESLDPAIQKEVDALRSERTGTSSEISDRLSVFLPDEGYKKALTQYDVMMTMLATVGASLVLVVAVSQFFLIRDKLFTMIEIRLGQYALYFAYGFPARHLVRMIQIQVAFSALLGIALSIVLAQVTIIMVNAAIAYQGLPAQIRLSLGLDVHPLFLQPTALQALLLSLVVLAVLMALSWRLTQNKLRIGRAQFPSDLTFAARGRRGVGTSPTDGTTPA